MLTLAITSENKLKVAQGAMAQGMLGITAQR